MRQSTLLHWSLAGMTLGFVRAATAWMGSDRGAMHIASALGKASMASSAAQTRVAGGPWGVSHVLPQPGSLDVTDVGVD